MTSTQPRLSAKSTRPHVIALLRVSTEEQAADDRAGLDRQQTVINRTVTEADRSDRYCHRNTKPTASGTACISRT